MVSLRTQTIKIVAISLITIAIAGTVWVVLESRLQQEQKLFLEGSELALSAKKQAELLITGLLIPEEFGSVPIHLDEIKQLEKLSDVQIIHFPSEPDIQKAATRCKTVDNGTLVCINRSQRAVTTLSSISVPDKKLGWLLKQKQLSSKELQTTLMLPLVPLIGGFFSAFLVIALWVGSFLKRHVRGPLLSLKDTLEPVLQNKKGAPFPKFRVMEVQSLATQMGQLVKKCEERKNYSTISETARTLAHQLKKPIVSLKMGLEAITKARNLEEAVKLSESLDTAVDEALSDASDIIEMTKGFGEYSLSKIAVPPEFLIASALKKTFRFYPSANVSIHYDFNHSLDAEVDVSWVMMIFSNIIGNAIEAMRGKGDLTFRTEDVLGGDKRFIEFSIENTNSYIPEDKITQVFDAFFTDGKPHGIGLGLAIAQKVVIDHGGKIWCTSFPEKRVRFHFTLPTAASHSEATDIKLPSHSHELGYAGFMILDDASQMVPHHKGHEADKRATIIEFAKQTGKKVIVHLIDNEPIYFQSFFGVIAGDPELAQCIEIVTSETSSDALVTATAKTPLLIICDYDMGKNSPNGLEITTELRRQGNKAFICIHSALNFTKTEVRAAGGDYFLPKPMITSDLIALTVLAIENFRSIERTTQLSVRKLP